VAASECVMRSEFARPLPGVWTLTNKGSRHDPHQGLNKGDAPMMRRHPPLLVLLLLLSGLARAADLTLVCKVKTTEPNGDQYEVKRKIAITWEARTYTVSDDYGSGYGAPFLRHFDSANKERIELQRGGQNASGAPCCTSWIDRGTGEYYFQNF